MHPGRWFGSFLLSRLVASPRGRAFLFGFMANAEEADEGAFDLLVARADLPDVQKMVRTHQADEQRHAARLRACLARTGVAAGPLPAGLRYIDRLDRMCGGEFRAGFPRDPQAIGVMKVYLLLQVVEERGVVQFDLIARALRPHDPASARAIDEIVRDEERHVRYARAIAARYAPDDATRERELAGFRRLEARAFDDHGRAFAQHVAAAGLVGASAPERVLWRSVGPLLARAGAAPG